MDVEEVRPRGGAAQAQGPAQSCFTDDSFATSLRRLEEVHQDLQDEQIQRIQIQERSQLTGCDEWVELHIANVHGGTAPSMVLYNLRNAYTREVRASRKRALAEMEGTENRNDHLEAPNKLLPEDAVLDVDMSPSRKGRGHHATWGFVTVANRAVADLLMHASNSKNLNLAPPTKSLLRSERIRNAVLTYSNIRRNPRDVPMAKVMLPASNFGIVEVLNVEARQDPAAASSTQRKKHDYSVLWETAVDTAYVCQLKKQIELRHKLESYSRGDSDKITVTSICIDLCSIKSAKTLSDGDGLFLALRLRHPPHLSKSFQERSTNESGASDTTPSKFELVVDPSKDMGAFGSPTAYHCVKFASKEDYDKAVAILEKARVRVFSVVHQLAVQPIERRANASKLCSYRLPNEHTPEGNLKKLLCPLFAVDSGTDEVQHLKSRVQHALEGLLVHGNLRAEQLPEFLTKLKALWQSEAISSVPHVLEQLEAELSPSKACNDGSAALARVSLLYENLQAKEERARDLAVQEVQQACGLDSSCSSGGSGAVLRSAAADNAAEAAHSHGNGPRSAATGAASTSRTQFGMVPISTAIAPKPPKNQTQDSKNQRWTVSRPTVPAAQPRVRRTREILEDDALQRSLTLRNVDNPQDIVAVQEKEALPGLVMTRRCVITPLRIILHPPQLEETNRILRQYAKWHYRFLRSNFATDTLGPITHRQLSADVRSRISHILNKGLCLSGRTFKFLGWSNSQLKSHSVWMYSEDGRENDHAPTAAEIRGHAGELHGIRIPAKFASRLGLCFSSTYATCAFPATAICTLRDVITPRGAMLTDGVGVITSEGLKAVIEALPVTKQKIGHKAEDVSAVQIRIGGCKGVLARWDNLTEMTAGKLVGIRTSMRKFEVANSMLDVEVCSVAKVMPCTLNRQVMMALLSRGLDEMVLWNKYQEFVSQLDYLLEGGEEALMLLRKLGCVDPTQHSDAHLPVGCLAACMVAAGIKPDDEPLLKSLVTAYRSYALKNVIEKCRLPVADGVVLMGVFDETGTLPSGTFWASWEAPLDDAGGLEPIGPMALPRNTRAVVGRAPVMAPADLRLLTAADPRVLSTELRKMTNVIVFPRCGAESEPSKMGGGDLDGDCFFIIWDSALVPADEAPALNYSVSEKRAPKKVIDRVQPSDVVEFFLNYIVNDQLGRIADGHLALADASPQLANDDRCMQLVELHSTAVDFAKTGVPVDPEKVSKLLRGVQFPDYMNGLRRSETMIGKISRDANLRTGGVGALMQQGQENSSDGGAGSGRSTDSLMAFTERPLEDCYVLPGSAVYLSWASNMVKEWTIEMSNLMCRYSVLDVGQVITGRVLDFQGRALGKEKAPESQQRLNRHVAQLMHAMRKKCFPHDDTAAAIACTDTRITDDPGGAAAINTRTQMRALVRGMKGLERLDDSTLAIQLRKVSALFQASNSPPDTPSNDRCVSRNEMLIRRALPWCVAAGVLVRMRTYKPD